MENINVNHHLVGETKIERIDFCGRTWGWKLSNSSGRFTPPYKLIPVDGEHDYRTCAGCQNNLTTLINNLTDAFNGKQKLPNGELKKAFPYCCSYHFNLLKVDKFDMSLFKDVPEMAALKIIYTNQVLLNSTKSQNWYKEITDYIEIAIDSFGEMPNDCGAPLFLDQYFINIKHFIKTNKTLTINQKADLLKFIDGFENPSKSVKKKSQTDFNILIQTYEKWFKIFPFELNSYFGNLKNHFSTHFPIAKGVPQTNMYSGISKVDMHSKSSLIEALINLTNTLLTQINGVALYEKGLITDANKIKLELVINSRKLKLKQGYKNSSQNEEQRYRTILKEWFNDEKKFIDEITPLLKDLPPQKNEKKTEQTTPKTFEELFYNPEHAEPCLKILGELQPPVIDAINNYIGKAKGVFPLWVKVLKKHSPEPLIKHFKDTVYKDLLNQKVKGLNLTKDASEFRKQYTRLENDKTELDIKTILSQYSQSGKLGK